MLKMRDLHVAKPSTHYHITGSLTDFEDRHAVILHSGWHASFRVKRCDAKDVGDHIDGRCDYSDYDPATKNNLRLTLLSVPRVNQFTEAVFLDMDYHEILPCKVMPIYCLARERNRV